VRRFFLSALGIGFLPGPSGTWASAATAAAILVGTRSAGLDPRLAAGVLAALGAAVTLALARGFGNEGHADPRWVVTDEVAGQGAAIAIAAALGAPGSAAAVGSAFVLFRALDVWKPGPIRRLERLPGATGIVADDLLAGAAAGALVGAAAAVGAPLS
jgi:phosphatidylglycerophosphatase A